jgi:hypothetical protein
MDTITTDIMTTREITYYSNVILIIYYSASESIEFSQVKMRDSNAFHSYSYISQTAFKPLFGSVTRVIYIRRRLCMHNFNTILVLIDFFEKFNN